MCAVEKTGLTAGRAAILRIGKRNFLARPINALGKIALSLQRGWHHEISRSARPMGWPNFLRKEEEQLVLVTVYFARPIDRSADVVSHSIEAVSRTRKPVWIDCAH